MITSIIVCGSLLLALIFSIAYLLSPRIRTQVERPKLQFLKQVQDFDEIATHVPQSQQGQQNES